MKRLFSYAVILVVLALPVLLVAVMIAEHAGWGPFAPAEAPQPANPGPSPGQKAGFDTDDYRPRRVVERDLPPIVEIPVRRPAEVAGEVTDEELVLGVEIHGEARAYPINQLHLPLREVFNDTLGGRAIAATW
jgi:hypothetical protein